MDGYDALIRAVMRLEPPLFLFGGFAEDVLLNGRPIRPHSDVDVLIFRDEVERRLAQFGELGFTGWEVWWAPRPELPLVYHATRDGLDLEPSVFERDEAGAGFVLEDIAGALYRVSLPADTFSYPPILVDGLAWRIVSPLCLYQIRQAIEALGIFGPLREKDLEAKRRLRREHLSHLAEVELQPRIVPLRTADGGAAEERPTAR